MESDRELLLLAAKAAGWAHTPDFYNPSSAVYWNPLTQDADALRLAVKLRMQVTHYGDVAAAGPWTAGRECEEWTGITGADPYAATRRAIVRAAAEIGRDAKEDAA